MEDTMFFIKKVVPTAVWALATIAASAAAFNTGNGFLIVCGVIAVAGALVRCVKVIKES
jgi:hypothetical protein